MVFSRSWWIDSVEASSHRRYCKQLCGRMEIHCWVTFACSRKATLNRLKALLKVLIYANLRHGVQMFSQISRIPDLIRKFWAKRYGLYAGVYGIDSLQIVYGHLISTGEMPRHLHVKRASGLAPVYGLVWCIYKPHFSNLKSTCFTASFA